METTVAAPKERVRRFSAGRVFEHSLHIVTFGILIATGLSQRFYSLDCSQWLILHLGGIDTVRLVHRFTGALYCCQVLVHLAVAGYGIIFLKWQPTMIITKKDFSDVVHNLKYYLGSKASPATSGRYTYKQKFEYWAILSGSLLMMLTGFVLWFPVTISKFMPGVFIPAAKVLHTNEAMVVVLIISIWHIYNSVFSPDVFPLDTSIFSGWITRERFNQEHQEETPEIAETDFGNDAPDLNYLINKGNRKTDQ